MFDLEKIQVLYEGLKAQEEQAVQEALAQKDAKVEERLEKVRNEIAVHVEKEIIEAARAPFKAQIELLEKALIVEEPQAQAQVEQE
jgi:hypothetical protein